MSCQNCGRSGVHGKFCKPCGRDRDRDQEVDPDHGTDAPEKARRYECTADGCGETYMDTGWDPCPACGAKRRRLAAIEA